MKCLHYAPRDEDARLVAEALSRSPRALVTAARVGVTIVDVQVSVLVAVVDELQHLAEASLVGPHESRAKALHP
jgi:hypothetical protein